MTSDFDFASQMPFGSDSFADNPDPRVPCLLILDTSGSMAGAPIQALNEALQLFRDEILNDSLAAKRVEIGIVTFGPVQIVTQFTTPDTFITPILVAQGDTPMGQAIQVALKMLDERKEEYKANGISYYRPWVFMMTDGAPTDDWMTAAEMIKEGESAKALAFFPVGVEGANMNILRKISMREPLKLQGMKFREFFLWLTASMSGVARTEPGMPVQMESPKGWAEV